MCRVRAKVRNCPNVVRHHLHGTVGAGLACPPILDPSGYFSAAGMGSTDPAGKGASLMFCIIEAME